MFYNIIKIQTTGHITYNNKTTYSKSFVSKAENFYYENKNNISEPLFFEEYMIRIFITKARYLIEMGFFQN